MSGLTLTINFWILDLRETLLVNSDSKIEVCNLETSYQTRFLPPAYIHLYKSLISIVTELLVFAVGIERTFGAFALLFRGKLSLSRYVLNRLGKPDPKLFQLLIKFLNVNLSNFLFKIPFVNDFRN